VAENCDHFWRLNFIQNFVIASSSEIYLSPSFWAMVAILDISESCWREVAPSTNCVSNVNGTISFQASGVNGPKSSSAKHQGSPQVSMRSEKAVS
jgi:hypothetical protein